MISQLCLDCGFVANHLTMLKRHGTKSLQAINPGVIAVWEGVCDCCEQEKTVTAMRDFYYPAERAIRYMRRYILTGGEK